MGVPIVQAAIQGRALFFIVDTGDETSMLSEAAAGRIGLDVGNAGICAINGAGGRFRAPAVTVEQVGLDTDMLKTVAFVAAGDSGKAATATSSMGLLGPISCPATMLMSICRILGSASIQTWMRARLA